ncbi:MAG: YCF48-related protein [Gallionella sp.]|nr:YCF48-related protein [Gallionella sp.]
MIKFIGFGFSLLVFMVAAYAFSPRHAPGFSSNGISVNSLLLLDAARAGKRIVAVGERGHIALSDDGGASWRQVTSPTQSTLTALYFLGDKTGWAVGHDSVILKSDDGGTSWRQVNFAPDEQKPLLDVWFADELNGYAVGAYGLFMETSDGGGSWQQRKIFDGDTHINAFASAGGKQFIAGEAGTLLRSDDAGKTWQPLSSPYKGSFFGILPLSDNSLLAFGLRGNVFRSDDAGTTWNAVESGTQATLMGGLASADGRVVLVGQGVTLVSRDQGKSFHLRNHASGKALAAVLPADKGKDELLLFGESGVSHFNVDAVANAAAK